MISYEYLNGLFKTVLAQSQAIKGRFHICPKFGIEINQDELGEVLKDLVQGDDSPIRYPMALLMPPRSYGGYTREDAWDEYQINMFFLKQSYVDSEGRIQNENRNTGTSMHTIPQDWHDMKRAAIGFMRALDLLQRRRTNGPVNWRLVKNRESRTSPVSNIGVDKAAGVRLEFYIQVYIGCELEDYTQEAIDAITIPTGDSHANHYPEHY